jgi:8-oxo-dGTP diphosphatase
MYTYTLGFIIRKDEILMVNRQKSPWMGVWNGVGGKRNASEDPKMCILREIYEETQIDLSLDQIADKGYLTWNTFDANGKGLYLYVIRLADDFIYETPRYTKEGILDWKKIEWINHPENYGVAHNIPYFLPKIIFGETRYHFHCTFEKNQLVSVDWKTL